MIVYSKLPRDLVEALGSGRLIPVCGRLTEIVGHLGRLRAYS